jgi:hypothetical protein
MIRSPAIGVAYLLWHRARWGLATTVAELLALAAVVRVFPPSRYPVPLLCVLFPLGVAAVQLLAAFTYTTGDVSAAASGFPPHMLILPIRSRALAGWPMLYGAATLSAMCLAAALVCGAPLPNLLPFWAGALASLAWFQATCWFPLPHPGLRVFVMVGTICGVIATGALAMLGGAGAAMTAGYLLAAAAAAYPVAIAGVAMARRGDGQDWLRLPQFARRPSSRRRPFRSAAAAQLWLEFRRNGSLLPIVVAAMYLLLLPGALRGNTSGIMVGTLLIPGQILTLAIVASMPVFLAGAFSGGLGKFDMWSSKAPTFNSFFATRTLSTIQFVAIKLRAAALSALVTSLIVAMFVAIIATFGREADEWRAMFHRLGPGPMRSALRLALLVAGLVFLTWREQATGIFVTLAGRPWVTHGFALLSAIGFAILGAGGYLIYQHPRWQAALANAGPWLIAAVAAIKIVIAALLVRALIRTALLRPRDVVYLAGAFLGVAVVLAVLLVAAFGRASLVAPTVILLTPLNRIALAALALRWNRHR